MGTLLSFAPFFAFVVIERLVSVPAGLAAGALVSMLLMMRDMFSSTRRVKVLETGTFLLFTGLTLFAWLAGTTPWSIAAVRLRVDAGLLLIVMASFLIRRPFTLQYARERTSSDLWNSPEFIKANYVISGAWAVAFAVMVCADIALLYQQDIPRVISILITVAAIVGAVKFTAWYPRRNESRRAADVTSHLETQ